MSNIVVKNRNDDKDKDGRLGTSILLANQQILVYRVRHNARYCNTNINIVNPNATFAEISLWVTSDKQPSLIDLIESKIVLNPDAVYVRTNLILAKNEAIFARSNIDNCVIRLDGYENNLL